MVPGRAEMAPASPLPPQQRLLSPRCPLGAHSVPEPCARPDPQQLHTEQGESQAECKTPHRFLGCSAHPLGRCIAGDFTRCIAHGPGLLVGWWDLRHAQLGARGSGTRCTGTRFSGSSPFGHRGPRAVSPHPTDADLLSSFSPRAAEKWGGNWRAKQEEAGQRSKGICAEMNLGMLQT